MFTRNWYKLLAVKMSNSSYDGGFQNYSGGTQTHGNTNSLNIAIGSAGSDVYSPSLHNLRTSLGYGGVILGTGSTPATVDDYRLSGNLINTVSASRSVTSKMTESGITFEALYTITNAGDTAITIGEIGLVANQYTNSANANYTALLERTVLDTPITIEPGGVGQVTYTITMNFPTE